ncbi:MAG: hypothetical protein J6S69_01585, partial [Proteobacteria bacterium]|nr:hypothetical protein [Pseudomonadota bacterium]
MMTPNKKEKGLKELPRLQRPPFWGSFLMQIPKGRARLSLFYYHVNPYWNPQTIKPCISNLDTWEMPFGA